MAPPKPIADLVAGTLAPALRAQGFAAADVVVAWADLVGERLGAVSRPVRVEWPRRARDADPEAPPAPATLVVRVESAFALEVQHLAPVLVERVNAYYGWRCIGRIVLRQGPVRRPEARPGPAPALDERDARRIADAVGGVDEEPLRAALDRLGRAVHTGRGRPGKG